MQEFISSVANQLGIDEGVAKNATAKVLGFVKSKVDSGAFSSLLSKLPGADQLLASGDEGGESSSGGMFGGLAKMASSAIGGGAGEGLEVAGLLKDSGLDADKVPSFLTKLVEFVKDKAGDDVINQIVDKVPALKNVLGSD